MKKLTNKDYLTFKKECLRLQKEWSLLGWKLFFEFKPLEEKYAQTDLNLQGRTATIALSSELSDDTLEIKNPKTHAKHEMIHLLLVRFSEIAYTRFVDKKEMYEAEEECVRILEKIL